MENEQSNPAPIDQGTDSENYVMYESLHSNADPEMNEAEPDDDSAYFLAPFPKPLSFFD